jgi:hypothetical protein
VDPAAERREHDEPPVAQLVAEALDDDPPVGREGAGRLALVGEVREQVLGGQVVQVVVAPGWRRLAGPGRRGRGLPRPRGQGRAPGQSSIDGPPSPCQNGELAGTPGAD